jgi:8-oxo-dGTP pyrophosphatase MutT (NUDIX family)
MTEPVPEFGVAIRDAVYVLRPGGYAVVFDGRRNVAVVSTPLGLALPGGGQCPGESAEDAAVRETLEECGLRVALGRCVGIADELVFAGEEGVHYRKRCVFFLATVSGRDGVGEPDHELVWMPLSEAASQLRHGSQRWAVAEAGRRA